MELILGNLLASVLNYVPYALLFIYAFQNCLRFSRKCTGLILVVTTVFRLVLIVITRSISSSAIILYNYLDLFVVFLFGALVVKSRWGRMLFIGMILKNTADTIVIFAKFLEYLILPEQALKVYYWTYSISVIFCELLILPGVFLVFRRYFTQQIRESISRRWRILWLIPFFFYLTWVFLFYYSSDKSDLELACLPKNSLFLLCSLFCQYLIYVCIGTLVESLQNEARLQTENHAMQLQNMQYQHIQTQISESRKTRHDLRHHLTAISSFVEQEDYDKLKDYLSSYVTPTIWQSQVQYCSNTVLNIMLSYYSAKCISNDIDCHMVLQIPEELPLSDTEITILFGNLLENAVDACLSIPEGTRRQLSLYGREMNHNLLFTVENTFSNPIRQTKKGDFHSTKHKGLGLGISSCKDIVSRHEGELEITTEDRFRVNILLPPHIQSR